MLAGIYYGSQYGGSTTAILVNLPGESASVVTVLDGYQMARQGRAGPALAIAAIGSFFAGTVATFLLAAFAPPLAEVAFKFGPAEYFSLMVLGLVAAVVLANGSVVKALAMVVLGLLLGMIGTDVNSGVARFSFDIPELTDGVEFAVVAMGMFGFAEIILNLEQKEDRSILAGKIKGLFPTMTDLKASAMPIIRGTMLGSFLGILPGGGATLSAFSSYALEKKMSRTPERFGKGAIEGVAGPEAANNAGLADVFRADVAPGPAHQRVMALMIAGHDDPQHPAGSAGDVQQPDPVLGADLLDVDRQCDAGDPEPADDRHLDQAADHSVRLLYPAILLFCCIGALLRQQQRLRRDDDDPRSAILGYAFKKLDCEPAHCCSASCSAS
jgi:TctA family transporter